MVVMLEVAASTERGLQLIALLTCPVEMVALTEAVVAEQVTM
jgi:hypothetical protein